MKLQALLNYLDAWRELNRLWLEWIDGEWEGRLSKWNALRDAARLELSSKIFALKTDAFRRISVSASEKRRFRRAQDDTFAEVVLKGRDIFGTGGRFRPDGVFDGQMKPEFRKQVQAKMREIFGA